MVFGVPGGSGRGPGGVWEGSRGDLGGVQAAKMIFLTLKMIFCRCPGGYLEGSRRPRAISLNLLSIFGANLGAKMAQVGG